MHFVIAIINNKDLNKHKDETPYLYLALIIPYVIFCLYRSIVHVSIVYEDAGKIRFLFSNRLQSYRLLEGFGWVHICPKQTFLL